MGRAKEEAVFEFIREHRVFPNDDDTRVIIGHVIDSVGEQQVIKGPANFKELRLGMKYLFFGTWKNHPQYGEQFWFDNFREADIGTDEKSILAYLAAKKLPGIGLATARKIYEVFGPETLTKMRDEPETVADQVSGVGRPTMITASSALSRGSKNEQIKSELLGFLKGYHIPKKVVDSLITEWGAKAVETIKENPFMLLEYKGVGFSRADKIYCDLGHDPKDLLRQAYALHYEITRSNDGDIWQQWPIVVRALSKHISGENPRRDEAVQKAINMELIVEREVNGIKWFAEYGQAYMELKSSRIAADCAVREGVWPDLSIAAFSDHQRGELQNTLKSHIGCFSGSPGTGKTYSIAQLIKLIQDQGLGDVIVLTPTGKAAVRAMEALQKEGVECAAQTAYSYLGFRGDGFLGVEAEHDYIICDEWSMADLTLNYEVLRCLKPSTHVLFVGDIHQLPPVGAGAPYRDMIESGVIPTGILTEIRRNSGDIVKSCESIRDHGVFIHSKGFDLDKGENFQFIETASSQESADQLISLYKSHPPWIHEIDQVWDMQVITPNNEKSPVGRKELNKQLQAYLNPDGDPVPKTEFRIGDKVINSKNAEYLGMELVDGQWKSDIPAGQSTGSRHYVSNGEQGEVIAHAPGKMIVKVMSPVRIISVPLFKSKDEDDEDAGSKSVWDLGYAITVHKSQGSEWKVSILIVDDSGQAKRVQTKNWLMTGESRTKILGWIIGNRRTIQNVAKTPGLDRKTFLSRDIAWEFESITFSDRIREFSVDDFGDLLEGVF